MIRCYSDIQSIRSFDDRFAYLKLGATVGRATFGFDRHLNQAFYRSVQWKNVRRQVLLRDEGCDLGIKGREIQGPVLIHHMNPVDIESLVQGEDWVLDPEFLIATTHDTHNAIHYGDASLLKRAYEPRRPGDTTLWRSERIS